jgi:hypothetical protein
LVEVGADDSVGGSGWERGEGELWFLSGVWLREKEMAWGSQRRRKERRRAGSLCRFGRELEEVGGKGGAAVFGLLGMAGRGKVWKMGEDERKARGAAPFVLWFWPGERGLEEMVKRLWLKRMSLSHGRLLRGRRKSQGRGAAALGSIGLGLGFPFFCVASPKLQNAPPFV